jgi:hypothetical protein
LHDKVLLDAIFSLQQPPNNKRGRHRREGYAAQVGPASKFTSGCLLNNFPSLRRRVKMLSRRARLGRKMPSRPSASPFIRPLIGSVSHGEQGRLSNNRIGTMADARSLHSSTNTLSVRIEASFWQDIELINPVVAVGLRSIHPLRSLHLRAVQHARTRLCFSPSAPTG